MPAHDDNGDVERTTYLRGVLIEYDNARCTRLEGRVARWRNHRHHRADLMTVHCTTADVTTSVCAKVIRRITLDAPKTIGTGELIVQGLLTCIAGMRVQAPGPGGKTKQIDGEMD